MYLFFKTLTKGVALNSDELSPFANWIVSNQILQIIFISILLGFLIILILRNYMKQEKNYIPLFVIIILLSGFCFYWFSARPTKIKAQCGELTYNWTKEQKIQDSNFIQAYLDICLYKKGISR